MTTAYILLIRYSLFKDIRSTIIQMYLYHVHVNV